MTRATTRTKRLIATTLAGVLYVNGLWAVAPAFAEASAGKPFAPPSVRPLVPASAFAFAAAPQAAPPADPAASVPLFGPTEYIRYTGATNVYTATVAVPAWVTSPFTLHVQNGYPAGTNRLSSATIEINGTEVVARSAFGQQVSTIERTVSLTTSTALRAALDSMPMGRIFVSLFGTNGDHRAPQVTLTEPVGAVLNTPAPSIVIQYADVAGAGELVASGVNVSSVQILVDGADRTSSFTIGAAQASGALTLGEGAHTVAANVTDVAGNTGTATRALDIDLTQPTIRIAEPSGGQYLSDATPALRIEYADSRALSLDTLEVLVNGVDRTALFTRFAGSASAVIPDAAPISDGPVSVSARIRDAAGNQADASLAFTVDTTAPQVIVSEPGAGQFTAAPSIDVRGGVVDASPVSVDVAGVGASVTGSEFRATGVPVGDGPEVILRAVAIDAAGNVGEGSVSLRVDRVPPALTIAGPASGAYLRGPIVDVTGTVADSSPAIVTINGEPAVVSGLTFTGQIAAADGPLTIQATAMDAAGNSSAADVSITLDTVAPVVTITEPAAGLITGQTHVRVAGTAADASPLTVRLGGMEVPALGGTFSADVTLPAEGTTTMRVTAADRAGNETTVDVSVVADRTPPAVDVATPVEGAVVANLPLTVQGTVSDATTVHVTVDGVMAAMSGNGWSAALPARLDGSQQITVTGTDEAGNRTTSVRGFVLDTTAPLVTLTAPLAGTLTRLDTVDVGGTVTDLTLQSVTVNGVPAAFAPSAGGALTTTPFSVTAPLVDGDNHLVVLATDATGRVGRAEIDLTRDAIPPTIELTAPDRITRRVAGDVVVSATDNLDVAQVVLTLNGLPLATFSQPPFQTPILIPAGARSGDQLLLRVVATDRAGNSAEVTRAIRLASDGAIVGQVLSDATGRPLAGATVTYAGAGAGAGQPAPTATDERGRYSFATGDTFARLTIEAPDMTTVVREASVASETGTVALDARLTSLAPETNVAPEGTTIGLEGDQLEVRSGSVDTPRQLRVTAISGQGLPALLPPGWSPIRALEIRGAALQVPPTLHATRVPDATVYLAEYTSDGWRLAAGPFAPATNGTLNVDLAPIAPFAPLAPLAPITLFVLIAPDAGLQAGAIGDPLPSGSITPIPLTATSSGDVDPPTLSPSGGTARGTLRVQLPTALPSGTVVQAVVTETFNLTNGEVASEEQRTQDLILYRVAPLAPTGDSPIAPTSDGAIALTAVFPIAPTRSFTVSELASGTVHLDILAGRETVRGQTGGSEPVSLTSAGATLNVARGALAEDTAVTFQSAVLSSFLPSTAELTPVAEFSVDFSGRTLGSSAQLAVPASALGSAFDPLSETLLVVRVDRVDGIPRLVVVALATLTGDRVVSQPYPGMSGVTRGGRYVLYRAGVPVGFIAGRATASGSPARAVVSTQTLPFVGTGGFDGQFIVATRTGAVQASARVAGTSLAAQGSADVEARATAVLDLQLQGIVTTAIVTPGDGAIAVSPGTQVEIASAVSLNAATLVTDAIRLLDLGAPDTSASPVAVTVRTVLSGSGRTLAVVPAARLAGGHRFRLEAIGLADVFGGAVIVPPATFITKSDQGPVYDVKKLVVSFPDTDGYVELTGPADTLPPGSQVLVINNGSGEVSTFPVFNDGAVHGRFFAILSDRLQITITDPLGNVTTFERNTYVDTDGTTSVNEGGGIIEGPSGAEVRVPEGALNPFDVALMKLSAIPNFILAEAQAAGLPGLVIAGGVQLTSPGLNFFTQEVDLAFPKPADAPEGAVYFVLRKLTGPDGRVAYESLDYAAVEGTGAAAKVVTASPPFSGYTSDVNSFGLGGLDSSGAVAGQVVNEAILAWAVDQAMPGRPVGGVITGRVLQTVWTPGSPVPTYVPVVGALVSGVDSAGQPLFARAASEGVTMVAVSQKDGTYALLDPRYTGGPIIVSATRNGQTITGVAYEANPEDTKSPGLRFARHIATTNLTYPTTQPAPPTATIGIVLTRLEDGAMTPIGGGVVTAGTTIGATLTVSAPETVLRGVTINGQAFGVRVGATPGEWELDGTYPVPLPGLYVVRVAAQPPVGAEITATATLRAIAVGGTVSDPLPSDAPTVIEARTVPKRTATGVAVSMFLQVTFSEPVTHVPGSVTLRDADGADVPVVLLAVGPDGPVTDVQAATPITSLTIQPLVGLRYGTPYTLTLSASIVDLDDGANGTLAHKPLVPYETSFTTFTPAGLGATEEDFTAGGLAIVGDRAYVAQNEGSRTRLRLFDVSDPTMPAEITGPDTPSFALHRPPPVSIVGNPADLAVEEASPVTGGRLLAVATNPYSMPFIPANIRLFDVSDDQTWHWIGAVTLGKEPQDGLIKRVILRGTRLYALVAGQGKGVQVIDLPTARDLFAQQTQGEEGAGFWDLQQAISVQGRGFGETSIVQTVFLDTGSGLNSLMHDLAVTDLTLDGIAQPIAVVTGRNPIAVVNPQTGQVLYNGPILDASGAPVSSWGYAVEVGAVNGHPIALVSAVAPSSGATIGSGHVFVVVDLANPGDPRALGTLTLPGSAQAVNDIVLKGTTAYVGTESGTYVISLAELTQPRLISTITEVGGRLAFTDDKLLFGTVRNTAVLQHALGGVRSAALGRVAAIIAPTIFSAIDRTGPRPEWVTVSPATVRARVLPATQSVADAILSLQVDGRQLPAPWSDGGGGSVIATLPAGTHISRDGHVTVDAVFTTAEGVVTTIGYPVRVGGIELILDTNNDTVVDAEDATMHAVDTAKAFAFWQASRYLPTATPALTDLEDAATVRLRVTAPWPTETVRLVFPSQDTPLTLTEKVGTGTRYLSDKETAERQLAKFGQPCVTNRGAEIGSCTSGGGWVSVPRLPIGDHEFLLRWETDILNRAGRLTELMVGVGDSPNSAFSTVRTLDRHRVDFRPIHNWITVMTARRDADPDDEGPLSIFTPRERLEPLAGWSTPIPASTKTLTVLVHGFNVSSANAIDEFFPTYLRRLYWTGTPVLDVQDESHVVGIDWPGDEGSGLLIPFYFNDDEFHAFQTGKVLADWLAEQKSGSGGVGRLNILAHSLGNVAVHSALTFLEPGVVDTLVMNQAPIPAEAFSLPVALDDQGIPSLPFPGQTLLAHAIEHGFPSPSSPVDARWQLEWDSILRARDQAYDVTACEVALTMGQVDYCGRAYYDRWKSMTGGRDVNGDGVIDDEDLRLAYVVRWSQTRPDTWDPRALPTSGAPARGPWRGIFAGNLVKVRRLVNTFNSGDKVVDEDWYSHQLLQKPWIGVLGLGFEGPDAMLWGNLPGTTVAEDLVWSGGTAFPSAVRQNTTRQWSELAYWFPATTKAVGVLRVLNDGCTECDFTAMSGSGRLDGHSYLRRLPLPTVWEAFSALVPRLKN